MRREVPRRIQQRLVALDAGDLHAELGSLDGGDVAAGAGTDDDDVV